MGHKVKVPCRQLMLIVLTMFAANWSQAGMKCEDIHTPSKVSFDAAEVEYAILSKDLQSSERETLDSVRSVIFGGVESRTSKDENLVSNYLKKVKDALTRFENSPAVLKSTASALSEIVHSSYIHQEKPHRLVFDLIHLFYAQKNHTSESLLEASKLATSLRHAIEKNELTSQEAIEIVNLHETSIKNLPPNQQINAFFKYYGDLIKIQNNNIDFHREKLTQFLRHMLETQTKLGGFSYFLSFHLSYSPKDFMTRELADVMIQTILFADNNTLSVVLKHLRRAIETSGKLSDSERSQLLARVDQVPQYPQ